MELPAPQIIQQALKHRTKESVTDTSLMPAAVLVLLYPKDGEYCVLLNKRSEQVEHHKGEVSFPGGARDPQDQDFLATALREVQEEMGIHPADVTLLGQLDDVVTRSRFGVRVFAGTIPHPYPFRPSSEEIAEVLEVPIPWLRSPACLRHEVRWTGGQAIPAVSYAYKHHLIFGATAKILQQFLSVLEEGLQKEEPQGEHRSAHGH
jgi:8-oxo-dGTP pyrophosphatase MutT (NUDIX family)